MADKILLGTWVTPEEAQRIKDHAERENRSVSQLIRLTMLALITASNGKTAA